MTKEIVAPGEPVIENESTDNDGRKWWLPEWWFVVVIISALALMLAGAIVISERHSKPAGERLPQVAVVTPAGASAQSDELRATQVTNGKRIMAAGMRMAMGRKAIVAALATSMRQTSLLNMASEQVAESKSYRCDYTWSNPGVGLFGQRRADLWVQMNPTLAARSYFQDLRRVDDWRLMTAVQIANQMRPSAGYEAFIGAAEQFYLGHVDEVGSAVDAEARDPLPESSPARIPDGESPSAPSVKLPERDTPNAKQPAYRDGGSAVQPAGTGRP